MHTSLNTRVLHSQVKRINRKKNSRSSEFNSNIGGVIVQGLQTVNRMSNHFTLKPDTKLPARNDSTSDYRITAPNVGAYDGVTNLKKDCLLFYYPDCEGLARRIAEVSGGNVELAEISWKCVELYMPQMQLIM